MATKISLSGFNDVKIMFRTRYVLDDSNHCLAVIGSIPELGRWRVDRCLLAFEDPEGSGKWGTSISMYALTCFSWKWVVVPKDMTRVLRWEEINNREQKIECTYDSAIIYAPWNAPASVWPQIYRGRASKVSVEFSKVIGNARFWDSATSDFGKGKSAFERLVEELENIPISRAAILKCQQAIKDKVVETLTETVQVMEQRVVKRNMIEEFLQYVQDQYPGINHELCTNVLDGHEIIYKDVFKQNHNNTKTSYGQIYFGDDETEFSCLYAYYTADLKFTEQIVKETHPILWGLINIERFNLLQVDLSEEVIEAIYDYFRYRILDGFLMTGVISNISWGD